MLSIRGCGGSLRFQSWEAMLLVGAFLFGGICMFMGQKRTEIFLLLFIVSLHIVFTNLGGDATGRHAIAIEPFGALLFFYGVQWFFRAVSTSRSKC